MKLLKLIKDHEIATLKVVYLLKKCKNSYLGIAQTKCRLRLNNYKSAHKSFKTKLEGYGIYSMDIYKMKIKSKDNLKFTIINQCTTNAELRKRKVYWQHCPTRFFPNEFNVDEESCL